MKRVGSGCVCAEQILMCIYSPYIHIHIISLSVNINWSFSGEQIPGFATLTWYFGSFQPVGGSVCAGVHAAMLAGPCLCYGPDSTDFCSCCWPRLFTKSRFPDTCSLVKYTEIIYANSTLFLQSEAIRCLCNFLHPDSSREGFRWCGFVDVTLIKNISIQLAATTLCKFVFF